MPTFNTEPRIFGMTTAQIQEQMRKQRQNKARTQSFGKRFQTRTFSEKIEQMNKRGYIWIHIMFAIYDEQDLNFKGLNYIRNLIQNVYKETFSAELQSNQFVFAFDTTDVTKSGKQTQLFEVAFALPKANDEKYRQFTIDLQHAIAKEQNKLENKSAKVLK